MSYGILLDSGAVFTVKARSKADAIVALRRWKQSRREALSRNDIVKPRLALGLVIIKQPRKAKAA
jgi:hypothetical protein